MATLLGTFAGDLALDPVESSDPGQRLGGDRCRTRLGELVESPAHVAPAEGELHRVLPRQHLVAAIAIDLENAAIAGKTGDRPLGLAIGRIAVDHPGRIAPSPWTIVPHIGEELSGLGLAASGIEHRRGRLVGKELGRCLQPIEQPFPDGPQQEGCASHPVGQGRAVQADALAGIDLRLAIQRKVVGIFGDEDLGDRRFGGQAAFDQPCRGRRLHHHLLADAAAIFRPPHHQNPELGRDDVEAFANVLADPVQIARAARADPALHIHHRLDAR